MSSSHRCLIIPENKIIHIVGAYGETLQNIRNLSSCVIKVQKDDEFRREPVERKVTLTGTKDNMDIAERLITDALATVDTPRDKFLYKRPPRMIGSKEFWMQVPAGMVGRIIGVRGIQIKDIQALSNTYIVVMDSDETSSNVRNVYVEGTEDQFNHAKQLIEDVINSANVQQGH